MDDVGGAVTLKAATLQLANSSAAPAPAARRRAGLRRGTLAIAPPDRLRDRNAADLRLRRRRRLTASQGVVFDGVGGLNVGPANLAIITPFLGDRGAGVQVATAGARTPPCRA